MPLKVIITAGGSGIGREIARKFLTEGHRVHVCDIDPAAVDAVRGALPGVGASITDVGNPGAVEALFAEALASLGGLDVLINNHGIAGPRGPIEELDYDEWDRCIRVNLSGMFYTIRNAVPTFKRQRSGVIINLATTSARTMLPKRAAYVAGKVGVLGLTKNCARELGPWNIRCNAVLPGFMNNARGKGVLAKVAADKGVPPEELEREALQYVSMRTWIEMSEIADLCVFLAGDGARHLSGQEIAVDGNVEWEE